MAEEARVEVTVRGRRGTTTWVMLPGEEIEIEVNGHEAIKVTPAAGVEFFSSYIDAARAGRWPDAAT